jgi:TonB family protein
MESLSMSAMPRRIRAISLLRLAFAALFCAGAACGGQPYGLRDHRLGRVPPGDAANRDAYLLQTKKPRYPSQLYQRFVEGYVVVEYEISPEGNVVHPRAAAAEPQGVFEQFAVEAAREWRFAPKLVGGQPVETLKKRSLVAFCVEDTGSAPLRRPRVCQGKDGFRETVEALKAKPSE